MSRNLDKKKCCYPKYLTVPSPSKVYKVIRVIFLIACLLTCLISPDLTMGILLILFLFANFANIWSFQICYSALVSVIKIVVCLLNDVFNLILFLIHRILLIVISLNYLVYVAVGILLLWNLLMYIISIQLLMVLFLF